MNGQRNSHDGSRPTSLAPASTDRPLNANQTQLMPFTCQPCSKRKVKCNKAIPKCSSCQKSQLECSYSSPQPRRRNKKLVEDLSAKLTRYENILRQHGLQEAAQAQPPTDEEVKSDKVSLRWEDATAANDPKFVAGRGRSKYVETYTWQSLEQSDGSESLSDGSQQEAEGLKETLYNPGENYPALSDPFTSAFIGSIESLEAYHPSHDMAMSLWEAHAHNVEPLCKVLHIPSTRLLVQTLSQQPHLASRADECLLFSIYHFAAYSMSDQDCAHLFGTDASRNELMRRFHSATRHALVNASFLKTTDFKVLQALVLFLLPCRFHYDPATYWIFTGVAFRIAQRMGLDRDGEALGLPPFEVQMRRRLFYQLMPLDGVAGQAVGAPPVPVAKIASDLKQPLNVNDDQLYHGMTSFPQEQARGATEMIFCLTRAFLGRFVNGLSQTGSTPGSLHFSDYREADKAIQEAENEIEEKFLRYCDVVNPLHFLTMATARSAITSWHLRARLPKVKNHTATNEEKKELFTLAGKILDTDAAVYACPGIQRFWWFIRSVFLWGTWDSLIYVLSTLYTDPDLLSVKDAEKQWQRVQKIYDDHEDLLEVKKTRHVAIGQLAIKAWDVQPLGLRGSFGADEEPSFVTSLRVQREESKRRKDGKKDRASKGPSTEVRESHGDSERFKSGSFETGHEPGMSERQSVDNWSFEPVPDLDMDFDIDATNWTFWEQLTRRG